jgi:hypothetical protein
MPPTRGKGANGRVPAYAKVLEPDDPSMRIYQAGLRPYPGPPGHLLADALRRTGGSYETTSLLTPQLRDDIRDSPN